MTYPRGNGRSEKNLIELIEWVESLDETPVDYAEAARQLRKNRKECAEWLKGKDAFWIVSEEGADKKAAHHMCGESEENMDERKFLAFAKETVVDYFNGRVESTDKNGKITVDDVFVVWFCKTLQNSKALLSTNVPDGMYYELTYNGDKNEAYLDAYKKWQNVTVTP